MKQINLLGIAMKNISFDEDGIYSISPVYDTHIRYCEVLPEEIETLRANTEKITLPKIEKGDVIYFDKNVAFPKLLLGRLDLNISRTIKPDKSTKIIMNRDNIISKSDLENLESGYIIMVGGTDETNFKQVFYIPDVSIKRSESEGVSLSLMQQYFPGIWKRVTILPDNVTEDNISIINLNPEKITSVRNIAEYTNSQLPVLDTDCANTLISLFKADKESKKLAVNMILSNNISPILYDIAEAIMDGIEDFDDKTKASINYKYLRMLLRVNPSSLYMEFGNPYPSSSVLKILSNLFHNSLLSPDQKFKVWKKFKDCISRSYYRGSDTYKSYNMPTEYDPKRETSNSSGEVETK